MSVMILSSCVDHAQIESDRLANERKNKEQTRRLLEDYHREIKQYQPKEATGEEQANAEKIKQLYYQSLVASIVKLDDGITPADAIAKAAVLDNLDNLDKLRAWKRADMAHLSRTSEWFAKGVDRAVLQLPSENHYNETTLLVLKYRKMKR